MARFIGNGLISRRPWIFGLIAIFVVVVGNGLIAEPRRRWRRRYPRAGKHFFRIRTDSQAGVDAVGDILAQLIFLCTSCRGADWSWKPRGRGFRHDVGCGWRSEELLHRRRLVFLPRHDVREGRGGHVLFSSGSWEHKSAAVLPRGATAGTLLPFLIHLFRALFVGMISPCLGQQSRRNGPKQVPRTPTPDSRHRHSGNSSNDGDIRERNSGPKCLASSHVRCWVWPQQETRVSRHGP